MCLFTSELELVHVCAQVQASGANPYFCARRKYTQAVTMFDSNSSTSLPLEEILPEYLRRPPTPPKVRRTQSAFRHVNFEDGEACRERSRNRVREKSPYPKQPEKGAKSWVERIKESIFLRLKCKL